MLTKTEEAVDERVRAAVLAGKSLRVAAAECGVSTSVIQRVKQKMDLDKSETRIRQIIAEMLAGSSLPGPTGGLVVPAPVAFEQPAQRFAVEGRTSVVDLGRKYERIAFLSDLHHPFQDDAAIDCALAALADFRPQLLILGGDYFDCYSVSDHDKDPGRADYLQDEFDGARETHRKIEEAVRGADVVWVDGNHEERINRIQRAKPGLFKLRALELPRAAELPARWLYHPDQTRFRAGPLTFLHGNLKGRGTSSMHAAKGMLDKLRTSCLFGHLHRFQAFHQTGDDGSIRGGFANGHLCDVSKAHYITNPDWQQGFSTIEFDWHANVFSVTPHLIVRGRHRWRGKTYPT